MPKDFPIAAADQADEVVLDRLVTLQRICIGIVIVLALTTLCTWIISERGVALPAGFTLMKFNTALAALASAVGLMFSKPYGSPSARGISRLLALFVLLIACGSLVEHAFGIRLRADTLIVADLHSLHPGLMSPESGSSFALFSVVLLFIRFQNGVARYIADISLILLSFLVLVVVAGFFFGATSPFEIAPSNWTSPQTLLSLILLSFAAFVRRAEHGAFPTVVGSGIGSRMARLLGPFVLILPFLREVGRVRLTNNRLFPEHYTSAILASLGAAVSMTFVIILAWRINNLERKVKDLSLRDELTGLANLRGFRVLADQGLRLATRSKLPFSVLYVDVDELKQINDKLGHSVGSQFLVETANLLRRTFRESDVLGRIGGDEFAVGGLFSQTAISVAAERLQAASGLCTPGGTRQVRLSLSVGYVTCRDARNESLDDILARADKAMYEQKRMKKSHLD